MFAIAAVIAFAIAFILHVAGHGAARFVTDAEILGWLLIAAHLAWPVFPLRRSAP